tara:strand:- start:3980 stop:4540 length:561 start_codon:yes stop_codon:yes gene_type:complete
MTKNTKYLLGVFGLIIFLFLLNRKSQSDLNINTSQIFQGDSSKIFRFQIINKTDTLDLIRNDSTWTISQADTLIIKENQLEKLFDRILKVEKEIQVTKNPEKWTKFGVNDSLGKKFIFYDENKEILGEYIFGNEGQDYQHNYVRKADEKDVFRTNDNIYYLLNTSVTYWGKNPPKPKTDPDTTKAS